MMRLILFTLGLMFIFVPFVFIIAAIIDSVSPKRFSRRPTSSLPEDDRISAC